MKPDERALLLAYYEATVAHHEFYGVWPRDLPLAQIMPYKRVLFLLEKWTDKGWYDYGVSLDLGWLTEEGRKVASALEGAEV